jgi:hypothetical protein
MSGEGEAASRFESFVGRARVEGRASSKKAMRRGILRCNRDWTHLAIEERDCWWLRRLHFCTTYRKFNYRDTGGLGLQTLPHSDFMESRLFCPTSERMARFCTCMVPPNNDCRYILPSSVFKQF